MFRFKPTTEEVEACLYTLTIPMTLYTLETELLKTKDKVEGEKYVVSETQQPGTMEKSLGLSSLSVHLTNRCSAEKSMQQHLRYLY